MTAHNTRVELTMLSTHRSKCECGWIGPWHGLFGQGAALRDANRHQRRAEKRDTSLSMGSTKDDTSGVEA